MEKSLGENDEALAEYERAVELDPNYGAAQRNIGRPSRKSAGLVDRSAGWRVNLRMPAMTPETLRQAGLDALRRDLGAAGMVRFIQLFEAGKGDYTAERWQWLREEANVKTVAEAIEETKAQKERGEA